MIWLVWVLTGLVLPAALGELGGKLRVCQQLAGHGHEVRLALGNDLLRHLGLDTTHRDHRDRSARRCGPGTATRRTPELELA